MFIFYAHRYILVLRTSIHIFLFTAIHLYHPKLLIHCAGVSVRVRVRSCVNEWRSLGNGMPWWRCSHSQSTLKPLEFFSSPPVPPYCSSLFGVVHSAARQTPVEDKDEGPEWCTWCLESRASWRDGRRCSRRSFDAHLRSLWGVAQGLGQGAALPACVNLDMKTLLFAGRASLTLQPSSALWCWYELSHLTARDLSHSSLPFEISLQMIKIEVVRLWFKLFFISFFRLIFIVFLSV